MNEEQANPSESPPKTKPGPPGERVRTACAVILAICVAGAALKSLRGILTPMLIALFLFYLIRPVGSIVAKWNIPRWLAYSVVLSLLIIFVTALSWLAYLNVQEFVNQDWTEIEKSFQGKINLLAEWTGFTDGQGKPKKLSELWGDQPLTHSMFFFGVELAEVLVMAFFYLVFMFIEAKNLPRRIAGNFAQDKIERYMDLGKGINEKIQQFLRAKTYVSLGLGATTGLLCYFFGVKLWLLWGIVMFLSNYITYIGSIVAPIPAIAVAFLDNTLPIWMVLLLAVLLYGNRFLWIDFIEIRVLGRYLNISPLLILFSIALFAYLWGVVGMILAVPLLTTIKIVLSSFENTNDLAVLISEE